MQDSKKSKSTNCTVLYIICDAGILNTFTGQYAFYIVGERERANLVIRSSEFSIYFLYDRLLYVV